MKPRVAAYAVATALTALVFAVSGAANLLRAEHVAIDLAHLGYPVARPGRAAALYR